MSTTTCTRCGNLVPAMGGDPRHPDWCPTCAARATGEVGPMPPTDTQAPFASVAPRVPLGLAPLPVRLLEATVIGVAAAAVGGLAWWAICSTTERQFAYGAIVVGVLIGQAVLIGARRPNGAAALIAAVAALATFVVAEYFVQRSLAIKSTDASLPLWSGLSFARQVVTETVKDTPTTGLFWGVGVVAAAVSSLRGRPVL